MIYQDKILEKIIKIIKYNIIIIKIQLYKKIKIKINKN